MCPNISFPSLIYFWFPALIYCLITALKVKLEHRVDFQTKQGLEPGDAHTTDQPHSSQANGVPDLAHGHSTISMREELLSAAI